MQHAAMGHGQGLGRHQGAEIGAADAYIDHRVEGLAGGAAQVPVMHRGDEAAHFVAFGGRVGAGILARRLEPVACPGAQGHMHGGAMLGRVDAVAGEQPGAEAREVGGESEVEQGDQRLRPDRGFGEIERHVAVAGGEAARPFGVGVEQGADRPSAGPRGEVGEAAPGAGNNGSGGLHLGILARWAGAAR